MFLAAGKARKLEQSKGIAIIEMMKGCLDEDQMTSQSCSRHTAFPLDGYCGEPGANGRNRC